MPPAAEVPASSAQRVELERVETARLNATIAASGSIEARRVTEVGTEVPGRIVAVLVEVGDRVEAGAPLFRIDAGPYRMALAEAEYGGWLGQLLTHPVHGLDRYEQLLDTLTTAKDAIKVYCEVA